MITRIYQSPSVMPAMVTLFNSRINMCCPVIIGGRLETENYLPFGKETLVFDRTKRKPDTLIEIWENKFPWQHVHQGVDNGKHVKILITSSFRNGKSVIHVPNQNRNFRGSCQLTLPLWQAKSYTDYILDSNILEDEIYIKALANLFEEDRKSPTINIEMYSPNSLAQFDSDIRDAVDSIRHPGFREKTIMDIYKMYYGHGVTAKRGFSDVLEMMDVNGKINWEDILKCMADKPKMVDTTKHVKVDEIGENLMNTESPTSSQKALIWNTIPINTNRIAYMQKLSDLVRAVMLFSCGINDFTIRFDPSPANGKMYITKGTYTERNNLGEFTTSFNSVDAATDVNKHSLLLKKEFENYIKDTWSVPASEFKFIVLSKMGLNLVIIAWPALDVGTMTIRGNTASNANCYRYVIPMAPIISNMPIFHHENCDTQVVKRKDK